MRGPGEAENREGVRLPEHCARNLAVGTSPRAPPLRFLFFPARLRMRTPLTSGVASGSRRYPQVYRGFLSGPAQPLHMLHMQGGATRESSPHAAPLRRRLDPEWWCIGQPYACPMQMPYSTAERVGSAALVAVGVPTVTGRRRSDAESQGFESLRYLECLGERGGRPANRAKDPGQQNRTHPPPETTGTTRRGPERGEKPRKPGQRAEDGAGERRPEAPAEGQARGARRTAPNAEHGQAPQRTHPPTRDPGETDERDTPCGAARPEGRHTGTEAGRQAPTFAHVAA